MTAALRVMLVGVLVMLGGQAASPEAEGSREAQEAFAAQMAALRGVERVQGSWVNEKAMLDVRKNMVSQGVYWAERTEGGEQVRVRWGTREPFVSDLILVPGKRLAKSQHETEWVDSGEGKPGLTAVMWHLAGWSVGRAGPVGEGRLYALRSLQRETEIDGPPEVEGTGGGKRKAWRVDLYTLVPVDREFGESVGWVRLGFRRGLGVDHLVYAEVKTGAGDVLRHWFTQQRINGRFGADVFEPREGKR